MKTDITQLDLEISMDRASLVSFRHDVIIGKQNYLELVYIQNAVLPTRFAIRLCGEFTIMSSIWYCKFPHSISSVHCSGKSLSWRTPLGEYPAVLFSNPPIVDRMDISTCHAEVVQEITYNLSIPKEI